MADLFHPLCGSDPRTLFKLFMSNGGIALNRLPQASLALAFMALRQPFSALERLWFGQGAPVPSQSMTSPIFVVGYWRSGTTHLHNLLSQDPAFGYISPLATGLPWDILGLVSVLEPLLARALPSDRHVDRVAVTLESPQEDSIALASMVSTSYYHGIYFPKHFESHFRRGVFFEGCTAKEIEHWQSAHIHLLQRVSLHQHNKPLLIKNPVYTGHIARLRRIWPGAKFIHIYRNPYTVFQSSRHFFNCMVDTLALQHCEQIPIDELILESYPRLLSALDRDKATLPPNDYVEVRFEDLETHPIRAIQTIYRTLDLPDFDQIHPRLDSYLAGIQSYQKNRYDLDAKTIQNIESSWSDIIHRWGYQSPMIGRP